MSDNHYCLRILRMTRYTEVSETCFFFFKLKRHCVLFCEQAVEDETGNCLHRSLDEYFAIIE